MKPVTAYAKVHPVGYHNTYAYICTRGKLKYNTKNTYDC